MLLLVSGNTGKWHPIALRRNFIKDLRALLFLCLLSTLSVMLHSTQAANSPNTSHKIFVRRQEWEKRAGWPMKYIANDIGVSELPEMTARWRRSDGLPRYSVIGHQGHHHCR